VKEKKATWAPATAKEKISKTMSRIINTVVACVSICAGIKSWCECEIINAGIAFKIFFLMCDITAPKKGAEKSFTKIY
jgi:hypothetical protein